MEETSRTATEEGPSPWTDSHAKDVMCTEQTNIVELQYRQ